MGRTRTSRLTFFPRPPPRGRHGACASSRCERFPQRVCPTPASAGTLSSPRKAKALSSQQSKVVGLIFGGASGEHDVSIRSAAVAEGLAVAPTKRYRIQHIYIDRQGRWWGDAIARYSVVARPGRRRHGRDSAASRWLPGGRDLVPSAAWPQRRRRHHPGAVQPDAKALRGLWCAWLSRGHGQAGHENSVFSGGLPQGPYRPCWRVSWQQQQLLDELEAQWAIPASSSPPTWAPQ